MPIITPKFWYRHQDSKPNITEIMMCPLSKLYQIVHNINMSSKKCRHAPIPVICIGNITAGGSGKTPTIIALNKLIRENNLFKSPFFLSRGYGREGNSTRVVEVHDHTKNVGDEALLLASHSKTIVSVNRYDGAIMGHELGADLILMDDGFQNPNLYKDLSIIIIDGKTGLGNRKTIPSGPLREPIDTAFKRSNAVIIIGEDKTNITPLIPNNIPIFKSSITPYELDGFDLSKKYIGFAGLAHPQKLLSTLQGNDFNVLDFHEFADHHPYSDSEINILIDNAQKTNAQLITTEKDYMRIPHKYRSQILFLPIELVFNNEQEIVRFLNINLNSTNTT